MEISESWDDEVEVEVVVDDVEENNDRRAAGAYCGTVAVHGRLSFAHLSLFHRLPPPPASSTSGTVFMLPSIILPSTLLCANESRSSPDRASFSDRAPETPSRGHFLDVSSSISEVLLGCVLDSPSPYSAVPPPSPRHTRAFVPSGIREIRHFPGTIVDKGPLSLSTELEIEHTVFATPPKSTERGRHSGAYPESFLSSDHHFSPSALPSVLNAPQDRVDYVPALDSVRSPAITPFDWNRIMRIASTYQSVTLTLSSPLRREIHAESDLPITKAITHRSMSPPNPRVVHSVPSPAHVFKVRTVPWRHGSPVLFQPVASPAG
ncbi:hypothetical protein C8Q80DRAFT_1275915 [Daedaleopsis nitida]|nr:hypothetical protein C8Q80DRAFT_1275915 [Daedaleopsis nitida]